MSCNSSDPARATGCGWADQAPVEPTRERGAAASGAGPASRPPPALPRPCPARGGARVVPLPHGRPAAFAPPAGTAARALARSAREPRAGPGLAGGRAAVRTSLLKVFTASMLPAQRPGARRRKRRRPARYVRKGGRATGPGGRGARRAGDAPQRRRGPGMAAGRAQRAGRRPPGRVGGGGGAGAAPSLLLRPARQRPPRSGFGPLHSPPPSPPSSSSHGLLCHLPAAQAAGTCSAQRRHRRKR